MANTTAISSGFSFGVCASRICDAIDRFRYDGLVGHDYTINRAVGVYDKAGRLTDIRPIRNNAGMYKRLLAVKARIDARAAALKV